MNQWAAFCMGLLAAWLLALEPAATAKAAGRWANTDYPSAEFFPILPWDPLTGWDGKAKDSQVNGLESIAACHFNMAGFVRPGDLGRCRKLGLGAILLPSGNGVLPLKYQREWKSLSAT